MQLVVENQLHVRSARLGVPVLHVDLDVNPALSRRWRSAPGDRIVTLAISSANRSRRRTERSVGIDGFSGFGSLEGSGGAPPSRPAEVLGGGTAQVPSAARGASYEAQRTTGPATTSM
jgi:hypothetical protein